MCGGSASGLNPLTRPAPAGESAGCRPPSPPRGRGQGFSIVRFENVQTPGKGKAFPHSGTAEPHRVGMTDSRKSGHGWLATDQISNRVHSYMTRITYDQFG